MIFPCRDIGPATATLDSRPRHWTRDRDFGPATRDPRLLVKLIFLNILAQVLPSWNVTIAYKTSSSLTIRWSNFPLSVPIQWFLVRYKEQNSSFSLIYKVSNWYNSHYSGSVLRTYQSYEVDVIAVANNSGNGAYSSEPTIARTNEGGKNQKRTAKIDPTIKAKYNKLNKTFFLSFLFFFLTVSGKKKNKQTNKRKNNTTLAEKKKSLTHPSNWPFSLKYWLLY